MKKIGLLLSVLLLISCQSPIAKEDLKNLNGYWEIQKVDLPKGEDKEYKVNETVDYFEVKNNKGFRQKVMPQFDGRFRTNDVREQISITEKDHSFFIEYQTKYGKWKEEILKLEDSILVLKNKDNLKYTYKKFTPFSLK